MSAVESQYKGWIGTYTGKAFSVMNPEVSRADINIYDIAHSLAMCCRWTGHVRRHYSVAQHSVLVARWLKRHGHGTTTQLLGLLHDSPETYIQDLSRPVKEELPDYKVIENRLMDAILARFGLPGMREVIKTADDALLVTEWRDLMRRNPRKWDYIPKAPAQVERISRWWPCRAEFQFLWTYGKLTGTLWPTMKGWLGWQWKDFCRA
jgi:hypothetical protein